MLKKYFFILILLIIPKLTYAEPIINNTSGNFIHGNTLSITGSEFGIKSPAAPLLWDDGTSNPPLSTYYDGWLPTNAQQGSQFNMAYRDVNFRNVGAPHNRISYMLGGAHAISNHSGTYSTGGNVGIGKNINSHNYFINYWYRVDPDFDEESSSAGNDNMKELVLSSTEGSFYPNGWGAFGYSAWCGNSVPTKNNTGSMLLQRMPINPANQSLPYMCSGNNRVYHNNPVGSWIKMQWEGVYNNQYDGPQIFLTTYPDGHRVYQSHYGNGLGIYEYSRGPWYNYPKENDLRFIGIGGFARVERENNGINSFRYFTGIYMDNSHARVMLGDNQNYDSCTILEPQIPSAWSDTSISVKINLGNLPDSGTAYLFVFDSDNNHSQQGYSINIGEIAPADTMPPAEPRNVR